MQKYIKYTLAYLLYITGMPLFIIGFVMRFVLDSVEYGFNLFDVYTDWLGGK